MFDFLVQGSGILLVIFASSLVMWFLIVDRYWYIFSTANRIGKHIAQQWQLVLPHKTAWECFVIRRYYISKFKHAAVANIPMIKVLVTINMLLGLLGTIVGMIAVFENLVLSEITGIRGLVDGVSQTIIPAIAGLLASLSGIFFVMQIQKKARQLTQHFASTLPLTQQAEAAS